MTTRERVYKDFKETTVEWVRAWRDHSGYSLYDLWWKVRAMEMRAMYYVQSFGIFTVMAAYWLSHYFWKTMAIAFFIEIWRLNGNIRGLMLHMESLCEWTMNKRV